MKALENIAEWQLDALDDLDDKLFYVDESMEPFVKGTSPFLVGRKGAGKSAIARHILKTDYGKQKILCLSVDFSGFPFDKLSGTIGPGSGDHMQYAMVWRFLIACQILKSFSASRFSYHDASREINESLGASDLKDLSRNAACWTEASFSLLGFLSGSGKRAPRNMPLEWSDKVDAAENAMARLLPSDMTIKIVLDQLDENYARLRAAGPQFNHVVAGLFQALTEIRRSFSGGTYAKIIPHLLVREDIFDELGTDNKNKWRANALPLKWDEQTIQAMLTHRLRISGASPSMDQLDSFTRYWVAVIEPSVKTKSGKLESSFRWILRKTQFRPRDFVVFLRDAARLSLRDGEVTITAKNLVGAEESYSAFLRGEIEDEMRAYRPSIHHELSVFSLISKQSFSFHEFEQACERHDSLCELYDRGVVALFKILYRFNVIGVLRGGDTFADFAYMGQRSLPGVEGKFAVHPGLLKALRVF